MRMKASLGMVCEFCTMIQATGEQRLSSWHTDSNLDGQATRCTGSVCARDQRLWRQRQLVSNVVWRDSQTSSTALVAARDVILVAARTGRVAQPMASRQRTLLRRHPSRRRRGRKERTECLMKKARLLVAMWNGRWSKSEKGKYNRNIR